MKCLVCGIPDSHHSIVQCFSTFFPHHTTLHDLPVGSNLLLLGWETRCDMINISKRFRVYRRAFCNKWKAYFGALPAKPPSMFIVSCHSSCWQAADFSGVPQVPPDTTSSTSGGTHTSGGETLPSCDKVKQCNVFCFKPVQYLETQYLYLFSAESSIEGIIWFMLQIALIGKPDTPALYSCTGLEVFLKSGWWLLCLLGQVNKVLTHASSFL